MYGHQLRQGRCIFDWNFLHNPFRQSTHTDLLIDPFVNFQTGAIGIAQTKQIARFPDNFC